MQDAHIVTFLVSSIRDRLFTVLEPLDLYWLLARTQTTFSSQKLRKNTFNELLAITNPIIAVHDSRKNATSARGVRENFKWPNRAYLFPHGGSGYVMIRNNGQAHKMLARQYVRLKNIRLITCSNKIQQRSTLRCQYWLLTPRHDNPSITPVFLYPSYNLHSVPRCKPMYRSI